MAMNFELISNYPTKTRSALTSLVTDNRMWLIQGVQGATPQAEVAHSKNGVGWDFNLTTPYTPSPARYAAASCMFNDRMYVVGGYTGSTYLNDCWRSLDGVNWIQMSSLVWTSGRQYAKLLVFDNKMWLIGGNNATGDFADVYYSVEGTTWTKVNVNLTLPWRERVGFAACVYDNRMWISGGYITALTTYQNDVWYTNDGLNWTRAESPADFPARAYHTMTVHDNRMVIYGGNNAAKTFDDLWFSAVGTRWLNGIASTGISLTKHCAVSFQNHLWLLYGYNGTTDVGTTYMSNSMEWQGSY